MIWGLGQLAELAVCCWYREQAELLWEVRRIRNAVVSGVVGVKLSLEFETNSSVLMYSVHTVK